MVVWFCCAHVIHTSKSNAHVRHGKLASRQTTGAMCSVRCLARVAARRGARSGCAATASGEVAAYSTGAPDLGGAAALRSASTFQQMRTEHDRGVERLWQELVITVAGGTARVRPHEAGKAPPARAARLTRGGPAGTIRRRPAGHARPWRDQAACPRVHGGTLHGTWVAPRCTSAMSVGAADVLLATDYSPTRLDLCILPTRARPRRLKHCTKGRSCTVGHLYVSPPTAAKCMPAPFATSCNTATCRATAQWFARCRHPGGQCGSHRP